MNCEETRTALDRDFLEKGDGRYSASVDQHLMTCPKCREHRQNLPRILQTFQLLKTSKPTEDTLTNVAYDFVWERRVKNEKKYRLKIAGITLGVISVSVLLIWIYVSSTGPDEDPENVAGIEPSKSRAVSDAGFQNTTNNRTPDKKPPPTPFDHPETDKDSFANPFVQIDENLKKKINPKGPKQTQMQSQKNNDNGLDGLINAMLNKKPDGEQSDPDEEKSDEDIRQSNSSQKMTKGTQKQTRQTERNPEKSHAESDSSSNGGHLSGQKDSSSRTPASLEKSHAGIEAQAPDESMPSLKAFDNPKQAANSEQQTEVSEKFQSDTKSPASTIKISSASESAADQKEEGFLQAVQNTVKKWLGGNSDSKKSRQKTNSKMAPLEPLNIAETPACRPAENMALFATGFAVVNQDQLERLLLEDNAPFHGEEATTISNSGLSMPLEDFFFYLRLSEVNPSGLSGRIIPVTSMASLNAAPLPPVGHITMQLPGLNDAGPDWGLEEHESGPEEPALLYYTDQPDLPRLNIPSAGLFLGEILVPDESESESLTQMAPFARPRPFLEVNACPQK